MDLTLPPEDLAWQRRAKTFAETVLFPHELELELSGSLPRATKDALRKAVVTHGFHGINHARDVGGQGCTQMQQTLINEELGKATGALWAVVWHPAVPLKHGTPEQIRDYLKPSIAGTRRACVAVTEPGTGSDVRMVQTRADRKGDRYVINGEKWFVTSGDEADYIVLHANVDGDANKPTLFLLDKSLKGITIKREPKFTHTYVFGHPEFLFETRCSAASARGSSSPRTGSSRRDCRSRRTASAPPSAPSNWRATGPSVASSSARRSASSRAWSSCSPTWLSK